MYAMKPFSPRKAGLDILKKQAGHSEKLEIVSYLFTPNLSERFYASILLPISHLPSHLLATNAFYLNL